jgi:hypothetical protein
VNHPLGSPSARGKKKTEVGPSVFSKQII